MSISTEDDLNFDAPVEEELSEGAPEAENDELSFDDDGSEEQFLAAEEEQDEDSENSSPRAEKRIRQLVDTKNQLKDENAELKALVEQLKRSNELQEKMQERQSSFLSQQEEQQKQHQRQQLMRQYGLDPSNAKDAIAFEQMEYKSQLENQLMEIKRQMEEQQNALQVERFNMALDQSLDAQLKGFNVDNELRDVIRDTAYDVASIKGLTAREAAEAAVGRYKRLLPKRTAAKAKKKVPEAVSKAVRSKTSSKNSAPAPDDGSSLFDWLDSGALFR